MLKNSPNQIDRISYTDLSLQNFQENYEKINKPLIIKDLNFEYFNKDWTLEVLYKMKIKKK